MEPTNSSTAATTTRTPRIVGYQSVRSIAVLARVDMVESVSFSALEASLVRHDGLDLLLREQVHEERHPARRDPAHPVPLVGRRAERHPVELVLAARLRRELQLLGAVGEVRAEGAAALGRWRGEREVVRVV